MRRERINAALGEIGYHVFKGALGSSVILVIWRMAGSPGGIPQPERDPQVPPELLPLALLPVAISAVIGLRAAGARLQQANQVETTNTTAN